MSLQSLRDSSAISLEEEMANSRQQEEQFAADILNAEVNDEPGPEAHEMEDQDSSVVHAEPSSAEEKETAVSIESEVVAGLGTAISADVSEAPKVELEEEDSAAGLSSNIASIDEVVGDDEAPDLEVKPDNASNEVDDANQEELVDQVAPVTQPPQVEPEADVVSASGETSEAKPSDSDIEAEAQEHADKTAERKKKESQPSASASNPAAGLAVPELQIGEDSSRGNKLQSQVYQKEFTKAVAQNAFKSWVLQGIRPVSCVFDGSALRLEFSDGSAVADSGAKVRWFNSRIDQAAKQAISVAKFKGWNAIVASGEPAYIEALKKAAFKEGINVRTVAHDIDRAYEATKADVARAAKAKPEPAKPVASQEQERTEASPANPMF